MKLGYKNDTWLLSKVMITSSMSPELPDSDLKMVIKLKVEIEDLTFL